MYKRQGQASAKKAVAIALRNRQRRLALAPEMQDDIIPKNILMIGPTGVGKTEIARRLARLVNAPFVKVEATKFTEVDFRRAHNDNYIIHSLTCLESGKRMDQDRLASQQKVSLVPFHPHSSS